MGMTPTIDVLLDVRSLLARPGGWIQGRYVAHRELGGRAYCIHGALTAVDGWGALSSARGRIEEIVRRPIQSFNDAPTTTQADVLAVIDRAIEAEWRGDPLRLAQPWELSPSLGANHMQHILERLAELGFTESVLDAIRIPFPEPADDDLLSEPNLS